MKILALDIGDVWTGIAYSDSLGIIASPYKTVTTSLLISALELLLQEEPIDTIVIGHPITLRGTKSDQTHKTEQWAETLKHAFSHINFILWDERYSSKMAHTHKKSKKKEEKRKNHARAAAYILQSYLIYKTLNKT